MTRHLHIQHASHPTAFRVHRLNPAADDYLSAVANFRVVDDGFEFDPDLLSKVDQFVDLLKAEKDALDLYGRKSSVSLIRYFNLESEESFRIHTDWLRLIVAIIRFNLHKALYL